MNMLRDPQHQSVFVNHFRQTKYSDSDFILPPDSRINTGVMVLKPRLHQPFLRQVYFDYQQIDKTQDWEQGPLSEALIRKDCANFIDSGFNVIFYYELVQHYPFLWNDFIVKNGKLFNTLFQYCATTVYINSYFLHFPGEKNHMTFVSTDTKDEFEIPNFFQSSYYQEKCVPLNFQI